MILRHEIKLGLSWRVAMHQHEQPEAKYVPQPCRHRWQEATNKICRCLWIDGESQRTFCKCLRHIWGLCKSIANVDLPQTRLNFSRLQSIVPLDIRRIRGRHSQQNRLLEHTAESSEHCDQWSRCCADCFGRKNASSRHTTLAFGFHTLQKTLQAYLAFCRALPQHFEPLRPRPNHEEERGSNRNCEPSSIQKFRCVRAEK